ncbi:lysosome-associated membrane glycoprotein 1 [Diachasma alloeum]|uniref:lysosome-associated membrane glycoprotein 1 n=1 Tax=Diachasma alloeum TaxID=454923 RepID=UPI0007381685|nr:lysosome-associated membrane glycoprotein 1 [Diachasma alloeum]
MKLLTTAVFLCSAMLLVSGDGSDVKVPPEPITTSPAPLTTTKPPTTTTPTTTTTAKTTTPATTTTPKPTTTTPKTTTTAPPDTTTVAPNTTTVAPTTTSAPPTPAPDPKPGKWVVNGTNTTCIVLRMAAQFNVTYVNADNKTAHELITVPSDNRTTNATGVCGDKEQVINIKWRPTGADSDDSVVLHFVKNDAKSYSLHHIEAYVTPKQLPRIKTNGTVMMIHNASEYKTSLSNSYRCMRAQELKMAANVTNATAIAKISDLQFQAFRADKSPTFGYAEDCTFETQDVVPIAVGCALIALVVIVLVAYLVGRRRSQARGYVSM